MSTDRTLEEGQPNPYADLARLLDSNPTSEELSAGLAAAADRRGLSLPQLLDGIARAGRRTGLDDSPTAPLMHNEEAVAAALDWPPRRLNAFIHGDLGTAKAKTYLMKHPMESTANEPENNQ
ncbi:MULTISPECIES: hypothetical protein [Streptomyces]|uniref:Uncharacterized protein n=1 Tax=Streptomyces sindenensis TaxID=67363 RepID=A0ABW6EQW4_9ACTN